MPRSAAKVAQALAPSEHSTASPATTGASAAPMASAPRSGSTASTVWPARSRAISAGTCSAESPRLPAGSPRRRGRRAGGTPPRRHRREPSWDRRKKVSSASTTPPRASRAAAGARRKRCRQRKLVVRCTPQWAALRQAHAGRERLAVAQPAGLLAQPRQGGAGERVEGLAAGLAAVAAQPAAFTPSLQPLSAAVRAARRRGERPLEQPPRLGLARGRRQGPPERRPLLVAEPLDQVQQRLEIGLAHLSPRRHPSTGSLSPNNRREKSQAKTTIREGAPTIVNGTLPPSWRTNAQLRPREFLTGEEVERLRKVCGERLGRYAHRDSTMILIAYRHGLRVSELVGLRWDMIDLNQGHMHVSRLKQGRPSTHILRGSELRALRRLQHKQVPPSPYVFATERLPPMTAAGGFTGEAQRVKRSGSARP